MENLLAQNLLFVAVILLFFLAAIAIGALLWLGHRYLRLKELEAAKSSAIEGELVSETKNSSNEAPVTKAPGLRTRGADIVRSLRSQNNLYCSDHPDMISVGQCAISGESYCEHCLTSQGDVKLAKKYMDLYLDNEWKEVLMLKNQEISQDAADRIVKVKRSLWSEESRPLIVQGHYKINVENDEIEAFTVVIAREDDLEYIKKELSFINKTVHH